jgi:hypothetical protein
MPKRRHEITRHLAPFLAYIVLLFMLSFATHCLTYIVNPLSCYALSEVHRQAFVLFACTYHAMGIFYETSKYVLQVWYIVFNYMPSGVCFVVFVVDMVAYI